MRKYGVFLQTYLHFSRHVIKLWLLGVAYLKKVVPSTIFFKCVCNTTTNGDDALFDESLTNDSIGIIVNVHKYNKFLVLFRC